MTSYCNRLLNKHKRLLTTINEKEYQYNKQSPFIMENTTLVKDSSLDYSSSDDSLSDDSCSGVPLLDESLSINVLWEDAMMNNTDYVLTEPITLCLDIN